MLRDVFYYGAKPNVHPRERYAKDLDDARNKCTTEHFWIVNEYCDYKNFDWDFDFDFLPDEDVWAQDHNNVWPSQHQKDSGTWLCSKQDSNIIVYRTDVIPIKRKNERHGYWKIYKDIDEKKFDFSWHPDPTDPLFVYVWGNKYVDGVFEPTIEYHTLGATEKKYMFQHAPILPEWDRWNIIQEVDKTKFDFTWRPDPREPAYIYTWGNKWVDAEMQPTLEYHVPGATERKYMGNDVVMLPQWDRWVEHTPVDKNKSAKNGFDFSWRPDPREPAYIYTWGNKYEPAEITPTLEYRMPSATEVKYMTEQVEVLPQWDRWVEHVPVDKLRSEENNFDFSWRPDPREPAYIYTWGNKYEPAEIKPTLEYRMPGATEIKYMSDHVEVLPQWDKWEFLHDVDKNSFDFSWRPDPKEPSYIYVFGNQWYDATVMPTIEYHCDGATERKYITDQNLIVKLANKPKNFEHLEDAYLEDYSWVPDPGSPPYIYAFGNQWNKPEDKISIQYVVSGATEYKYMDVRAIRRPCKSNWIIPDNIDASDLDLSWEPSPKDPPYIYYFATQWQKTGGVRYVVPNAVDPKYMDIQKVKALPTKGNWTIPKNIDVTGFDFSWHPDDLSPPFIYVFATQWALTGGPIYTVPGATEKKYVDYPFAIALPDKSKWVVPDNIDVSDFDFSWHPFAEDDPCIYQIGTQHQKTGGPRYIAPGTDEFSPIKYIDRRIIKSKRLPDKSKFKILHPIIEEQFDFSWHPDDTEEPYIYVFGNQHYSAEKMPTVEYHVEGATQYKYIEDIKAKLKPNKNNWKINIPMVESEWDFTWIPDPGEPPYIYVFGNQWNHAEIESTIEYYVPGAEQKKYISDIKATVLPEMSRWTINYLIDKKSFDFSWRPDPGSPPYIYVFGSNLYPSTEMSCVEYHVEGATDYKYMTNMVASLAQDKSKWIIPDNIDVTDFDFSWHPNPKDPAYIYHAGTQWQKSGGPQYIVEGATDIKFLEDKKAKSLPCKDNWMLPNYIDESAFDFSWHPDITEPPYIYYFPTQWALTGGPVYTVPGATEKKYLEGPIAKAIINMDNWEIPDNIDKDSFDFSWHPYIEEIPFVYHFGTQHQKNGGPKYHTPGSDSMSPIKYVDRRIIKAKALPQPNKFKTYDGIKVKDFDYSWHPDDTEEPYIYVFGNKLYPAEVMPTIKYEVEGATQIKYISNIVATLDQNKDNWTIPKNVDVASFDFSWRPNPNDPPYIYEFATVYNNRGGPRYVVDGATEFKYIEDIKAKLLPSTSNWLIPKNIDDTLFDFAWVPHPDDPPYIYEFGTQWQKTGGPKYVVTDATETKFVNIRSHRLAEKSKNWRINPNVKIKSFDFSWHPDSTEEPYIYVFGNTQYAAEEMPTVEYVVEGATKIKYVKDIVATLAPNKKNWTIPADIDTKDFDFSWIPNPKDPPYIYEFGTQWQKTGGPQYVVKGATDKKYVESSHAIRKPNKYDKNWTTIHDIEDFDFSWHPDDTETPYIYVFGNQWHDAIKMPTLEYHVSGAVERKYVDTVKAKLKPKREKFKELIKIAKDGFDFSWTPDPDDAPYIYVFGNQWNEGEIEPTIEYRVKGATEKKYINIKAKVAFNYNRFKTLIPVSDFDYSWRPNPKDPPYIYVFGNQWYDAVKEPTVEYHVPGALDKKYIQDIKAKILPDMTNWVIPKGCDVSNFDFSWHPDPDSPKYIYQFGTLSNDNDGPKYVTPDNNGEIVRLLRVETQAVEEVVSQYQIQTTLEDLVNQHPTEVFWATNKNINYDKFDFSWRPSIEQARYVHVFGSPDSVITQTYFVSAKMYLQGYKDFNFVENTKADSEYLSKLFVQSDMFFVDKGNPESLSRYESLKQKYPTIQKTRFLNSWVDTINRCINRSNTQLCWILNSELDYTDFNFNYYPDPWQLNMVHVFGTQWSHWGTTFLVNRDTFTNDTKYIKIIEHLSNLNFVKSIRAKATNNLYDIYVIDHGNKELTQVVDSIKRLSNDKNVTVVNYDKTYLQTIKNILHDIVPKKEHYVWICSSICNYNNFDFTYICDPFARDNLHVFPSDTQKFGDTFFLDVNHAKKVIAELEILQQFNKVNYNGTIRTKRVPAPVIKVNSDTHVGSLNVDFDFPYAIFTTEEFKANDIEVMNLWQDDTKELLITSTGASRIIVPKEAKDIIKNELYDYPYIKTASKLLSSKPLDIVFLSNGEKNAEENYKHLLAVTEGLKNRVVRVDGVNGRVEAYHAAVKASETPWAFTVFAKLKVSPKFDWGWQPDRLQIPKHYIFHAKNPVNGLEYGHQGMIAYNKQLVLNNFGSGLDFTLDDPHETVEILSGVANFNTDEYSTWRTSFREVIKLKSDYADISQERLNIWLTEGKGKFAKHCLQGATDAIEYYDEVSGDLDKLRLSYEWNWLKEYYNRKYK